MSGRRAHPEPAETAGPAADPGEQCTVSSLGAGVPMEDGHEAGILQTEGTGGLATAGSPTSSFRARIFGLKSGGLVTLWCHTWNPVSSPELWPSLAHYLSLSFLSGACPSRES